MPTAEEVFETYVGAWNEPDPAARRRLLERAWADDGTYTDPTAHVEGREALVEHLSRFRQQRQGARIVLATGVDDHHGVLRCGWRLLGPDGSALLEGIDFGELGSDGRLRRIVGFFGPLPIREGER